MITASVGAWERSCVYVVDSGLEALGCQDKVYLVVNLPIRGMPDCCSTQLVRVKGEGWWQGGVGGSLQTVIFVSRMPSTLLLSSAGIQKKKKLKRPS